MDGSEPSPTSGTLEALGFLLPNPSNLSAERGHLGVADPGFFWPAWLRGMFAEPMGNLPEPVAARRQRKEEDVLERRALFNALNKAPSVKQGTHWWAYKKGDKCCLQRLRGRKLGQLAQKLAPARAPWLTVPCWGHQGSMQPGFLLGWETGRRVGQAELGAPPGLLPIQTLGRGTHVPVALLKCRE